MKTFPLLMLIALAVSGCATNTRTVNAITPGSEMRDTVVIRKQGNTTFIYKDKTYGNTRNR
jgi:type IV pilus biogenesis protein CpaD/CtpE